MGNNFLEKYPRTDTGRIDMSKTFSTVPLPDLCEVQHKSFNWFVKYGVDEVFNDIFPVYSNQDSKNRTIDTDKIAVLEYVSSEWGKVTSSSKKKLSPLECKKTGVTYSLPLHVTFKLIHPDGTMIQLPIFMGDYPYMTTSGTFIINGSEKCVASQLVRSPGAYVSKQVDEVIIKKTDTDAKNENNIVYGSDIIPARGIWLEFLTDNRDYLSVRIDKQKKIPALTLLRAIGITSDSDQLEDKTLPVRSDGKESDSATGILGLFGYSSYLKEALLRNPVDESKGDLDRSNRAIADIFKKLRPGEPFTNESAALMLKQRFFDNDHYDLGKAGRFKIKEKLGIYNRLENVTLAEDLISKDGEIVFEKGHTLSVKDVVKLREENFFEGNPNHNHQVSFNSSLDNHGVVTIVRVFNPNIEKYKEEEKKLAEITTIIGTDLSVDLRHITIADILASFSYMLNIIDGIGEEDDTDHLGNKRVRCVGELIQEKFRLGLSKIKKNIHDRMSTSSNLNEITISQLINIKSLTSQVGQFFNSDSLSQFMDQTNPLAEITNKCRLSALGRGGLTRDRASSAVRDVHPTHYGRICPIETPEGQNIGLISYLACYARVNDIGFIETPYRPVVNGIVDNDIDHVKWLTASGERNHKIAQGNTNVDKETNQILDESVNARFNGNYITCSKDEIDLIDASPRQIVSVAAACIPFLENDDGKRALMGSNMQKQALPLIEPEAPFVGTGLEKKIAHDSGESLIATDDGVVTYVGGKVMLDSKTGSQVVKKIISVKESNDVHTYELQSFISSNKRTCINQTPIVKVGDKIKKGQSIADGPSMKDGELALGQNALIAFTTWHGYNYEDAILISEKCIYKDLFTNLIIEEYDVTRRKTRLGEERFTNDIPNISNEKVKHLNSSGIIAVGSVVREGDILVGKTTPRGESTENNNDYLLKSIFSSKSDEQKDASLRLPHGGDGIVLDVIRMSRENGDELPSDVLEQVKVHVVQKRKIQVGDKMSGRHGNKGVISKVLQVEDMPYLPDGTPIDILLSPMGVPSRMNIGQVLEVQLGMACKKLGIKVSTPVFDGATNEEIAEFMKEAGVEKDGKSVLYDGQTGERYDSRVAIGVMYMIKLDHMVEDKLHARAIGPYSLVTQQPLGGKAQHGGQRFGEMEVWALEAYGAAYTLQEMLTIKSDDMVGRNKTYEAILKGNSIPKPNMPESTRVLIKELQGLCINVELKDANDQNIDVNTLAEDAQRKARKIRNNINSFNRNIENEKFDQKEELVAAVEENFQDEEEEE